MKVTSTRSALSYSPLLGLLLVCACAQKDSRLKKLSAGISTDSVMSVMGVAKADRVNPYLVDGHYIEAMYFLRPGAGNDSASLADRNMSPVIVMDGKLLGWGWKQWDSIAATKKIPVPPK